MKYLLIVLSVIITLKLSAKEVIIDFNDPANFYEGYLFSNGIESCTSTYKSDRFYRHVRFILYWDMGEISRYIQWIETTGHQQKIP